MNKIPHLQGFLHLKALRKQHVMSIWLSSLLNIKNEFKISENTEKELTEQMRNHPQAATLNGSGGNSS